MIVLAIETAGPRGGVALLRDEGSPRELALETTRTLGAELAPAIKRLLREAGVTRSPDLVAVDIGPGSYTGIRIGIAAGKGLAFAWGCPLIGVSSADALAAAAPAEAEHPVVAFDASRGEVWVARYKRRSPPDARTRTDDWTAVSEGEPQLVAPDAVKDTLPRPAVVLGDGAHLLADPARGLLSASPARDWPHPLEIARLGRERHLAGVRDDPLRLAPIYFRANEAEEQRRKRGLKAKGC